MRILHIVKFYSPWIGGVERVVQEIAESTKDIFHIRILCCNPGTIGKTEIVNNVAVIRAGSIGILFSMPLSLTYPFLLMREAQNADVLHFHLPFPLADAAYLLCIRKKKKIVVTWHSDINRQKRILFFYKPFLMRFLKIADVIITTSQEVLNSSSFLGEFSHKCMIIPLFIDAQYWESLPSKEFPLPHNVNREKILLFVGRLVGYKGVEYLIDAMKGIDASLLIVGSGILEKKLKKRVLSMGLENNIFFVPHLSNNELKWCYEHARVCILPSVEKTEAFGLVQLEAMLFGIPVINTSLPTGVPHVSLHNETGLTVPPQDSTALHGAIQVLLSNETLAREMGQRGRNRAVTIFGKKKAIDDLVQFYNSLSRSRENE
jgi:glycosyltransferase involved in cell wall biosynthesis